MIMTYFIQIQNNKIVSLDKSNQLFLTIMNNWDENQLQMI